MKLSPYFLKPLKLFSIAGALSLCAISYSQSAKNITLFADPWCPFTCGENDKNKGLIIELAQVILGSKGYTVTYKERAWARSLEDVRKGQGDAVAGAVADEVSDFVMPKNEQVTIKDCFYALDASTFQYKNFESLKGKKIGIVQDYEYSEDISNAIANKTPGYSFEAVSGVDTFKKNIQKLNAKRIDAFIEEDSVFLYHSNTDANTKGVSQKGCIEPQKLFIAFSPHPTKKAQSDELAKILSDGMKDKSLEKQRAEIFKKYGLKAR